MYFVEDAFAAVAVLGIAQAYGGRVAGGNHTKPAARAWVARHGVGHYRMLRRRYAFGRIGLVGIALVAYHLLGIEIIVFDTFPVVAAGATVGNFWSAEFVRRRIAVVGSVVCVLAVPIIVPGSDVVCIFGAGSQCLWGTERCVVYSIVMCGTRHVACLEVVEIPTAVSSRVPRYVGVGAVRAVGMDIVYRGKTDRKVEACASPIWGSEKMKRHCSGITEYFYFSSAVVETFDGISC